ncbi:MAG: ATP-binding cassette domain-containing protein [Ignavibacteriales bacterium]|nr:MAG: ATP-binding cassette domain-containing protein [Ignavibacteriales bacterium]
MLTVQNLRKEYKDLVAVRDISFTVDRGKIFGLIGPNGAGKTTTIRAILNIIKPTSGSIRFDGKDVSPHFYNVVGYLPEERGLYKKSKVIDVIKYFAQLKGLSANASIQRAKEWLQQLNISGLKDKRIEELSKGNQQKIQFICSVIHNPQLLILDEPFSGFDPINQQQIKDLLLSFISSGMIIILSTHQMDTAEKLCSEILLIDKGKDVCSGSLASIKKSFAENHVKIGFEGNPELIRSLPGIKQLDVYSNYAEIKLESEVAPSEFLKLLVNRISITHFSILEPTLNQIFIDVVNRAKTGEVK